MSPGRGGWLMEAALLLQRILPGRVVTFRSAAALGLPAAVREGSSNRSGCVTDPGQVPLCQPVAVTLWANHRPSPSLRGLICVRE